MSDSVYVRASSVAEFFDCPLRWATKHLDGQTLPASSAARIGTAVHRSTGEYDASRLVDKDGQYLSIDDTADVIVETIRNPDEEVDWGGLKLDKAIEIGIGCHVTYCNEIGADADYTAVEAALEELPIDVPLRDGGELQIILTGTLDRIRRECSEVMVDEIPRIQERFGIADIKTGARAMSQSPSRHKAQIGVYELLAYHSLAVDISLPGQIIALQTSANYDAGTKDVENAQAALVGDPENPGLLSFMAEMLASGSFYGNASSFLCSEKYCPAWKHCRFR